MTKPSQVPELSVVVIVRNDLTAVRRLVASLGGRRQDTDAPYEVVVVDDGSAVPVASGLADLADDVPLVVVRRDGTGNRAAARSAGAARGRGRFLAFLDADQEVPAHWVAEHLRWQRAFPAAVVVGHRRHRRDPASPLWTPEVRTRVTAEFSENYSRIAAAWYLPFSCNLSVPAAVYDELGGYSDEFTGWGFEDHDFGYRAWAAGVPTVHHPHAWSWDFHHVVRTDAPRIAEWEANRRTFLARHPKPHAQAVALIDNYPSGAHSSPGQEWLESFRRFDDELRRIDSLPAPEPPVRTLTVLSRPDADHVRRLLPTGEPLRVVDGLRDSDLALEIQRDALAHIEYRTVIT
ncbi:glycosyltransferase family 2 protein [Streptomyces hygroscopicus]|uniref:GT2 family glycosyltransferase n=1 Tax=Streptomyces demainii TaxID=588122 RepID=A0ABT9L6X8_9ACTN|nr:MULTISPECIES: glycosyltransferase family 2 protein [Streptomyces]MDN3060076.1 glycosyltransferase [Streptomyces sp. SRF1]MDP9616399.1 GT2 family glycosyltransferase [Streptomyces demainii]